MIKSASFRAEWKVWGKDEGDERTEGRKMKSRKRGLLRVWDYVCGLVFVSDHV